MMKSTCNSVAIIIPCYNCEPYIGETIESALSQTILPYEIVVIDDGSTDGSCQVVSQFGNHVILITKENGGVSSARNLGIQRTVSENLLFLDADDTLVPTAIETLTSALAQNPEAGVAFGLFQQYEEETGNMLPPPTYIMSQIESVDHEQLPGDIYRFTENLFSPLLRGSFIPMGGALVRRSVFQSIGVFNESFRVGEDRDLWLRATLRFPFVFVKKELMRRRLHSNNLTGHKYLHLYDEFNINLADVLLERLPQMKPDDRKFLANRAAQCARQSLRRSISNAEPHLGRNFLRKYYQLSGLSVDVFLHSLLCFMPKSLLRMAISFRKGKASDQMYYKRQTV